MNRTHYCTQVQPASTIINVYDAQLCIYYTPEQATTGQITQTERETQSSRLDYVQKIYEIVRLDELPPNANLLKNPRFDDGTTFWTVANATVIAEGFYTDHSLRLGNGADAASAYQYLPPFLGLVLEGGLWHRSNTADAGIGNVYVSYTDGANTIFALNGTSNAWAFLNITGLTATKKVKYILVLISAPYIVDVTNFTICPHFANVIQTTRTNLLVKPEREDLLIKYFNNTFAGAADYSVLAAVASQSHKIFAVNYESSADIEVCLREATDATKKAFVRTTKGVYGQTLVHPWVLTVNTVFNLRAEGVTTVKGYVQYKTEA